LSSEFGFSGLATENKPNAEGIIFGAGNAPSKVAIINPNYFKNF
jgi:hypothetical protein